MEISKHLTTIVQNKQEVAVINEQMPLGVQDLQIEKAILSGNKVLNSSLEELDQMFRMIYMLVGLRPQFIPNELELMVLYDFVKNEYSNHTTDEILLAFKMVAKGDAVDDDGKIIELYDYFTPAYFGKVMKAYRNIASPIGNKIADKKYVEKLKELDSGKQGEVFDWREVVEADYQFYLVNIDTSTTYPEEHYNQLVKDDFIKEDFWVKKFKSVKLNLLNNLNRDLVTLQNSRKLENDPTTYKQYNETKSLIEKYKHSDGDADVELIAKQKVVAAFFKYNKELGNKNIYIKQ